MIFTVTVLFLTVGCEGVPRERTGLDSYYPALDGATEAERDHQQPSDRVLARIGDDTITESELRDRILDRYYGARALNGLVRESLFISEAGSLGLSIEAEEVVARVERVMEYVPKERITLNPDCGFSPSSVTPMNFDEAYLKLRAMCDGARLLRETYG